VLIGLAASSPGMVESVQNDTSRKEWGFRLLPGIQGRNLPALTSPADIGRESRLAEN